MLRYVSTDSSSHVFTLILINEYPDMLTYSSNRMFFIVPLKMTSNGIIHLVRVQKFCEKLTFFTS